MPRSKPLKLPDDFIGTVKAFLSIPVPPKKRKAKRRGKKAAKVTK
jgi:hypothetical protein